MLEKRTWMVSVMLKSIKRAKVFWRKCYWNNQNLKQFVAASAMLSVVYGLLSNETRSSLVSGARREYNLVI